MKQNTKQYTIRNIPNQVDQILRRRAKMAGKSFNQVILEALVSGVGESIKPKRDFSEVIGSITEKEALLIEEEIHCQRQIDIKSWKA
ncbi:MAG: hypothetical protein HY072_04655 [Deltaproteobacteria bacterium]|nr:hypothetical protein [Deltaproteobacteria bacterium]